MLTPPVDPTQRKFSASPTDSANADAAAEPCALGWAAEHLEVLRDLRQMGMTLARSLTRQVVAQTEADEARAEAGEAVSESPRRGALVDPALSFSRISRAVRLTLSLEARTHQVIEDAARRGAVANDDDASDKGASDDGANGPIDYEGIGRRIRAGVERLMDYDIRRAVEDTIEAASDAPEEMDRLKDELAERLREDEVFAERFDWPIGEAVALICQDLGLEPDWDRWVMRGWARGEAQQSPPGSPYATVERPLDPERPTGTEKYRQARGLPPLEEPLPVRPMSPAMAARLAARGPP